MKNKTPGAMLPAHLLICLLLFTPCAVASTPAEEAKDAGWANCTPQQDCATALSPDTGIEELILQGRQALDAGRPEDAGLIFERILLEQPWRLGVWLDYALSLQQLGDNESARAIYLSLLRQNPPEHLVPWLNKQVQATPAGSKNWQYGGVITLLAGRDNNLNRAPTTSNITLTMPSGSLLVLPLSDASRPATGTSQLARFDWQALHHGATGGDWLVQATFNARRSPDVGEQDYLQSSVALAHSWADAPARPYHAVLTAQNLQYSGQDVQRALRAGFYGGQHWQTAGQTSCSANYGAEWEAISHPSVNELDGQYVGVAAELGCKPNMAWQLLLRVGTDHAKRHRPGGNQKRVELFGQLGGQAGAGKWLALAELIWLRDDLGYNPLLDNNAVRDIRRGLLKFEYEHPLGGGLNALASTEVFQQRSNLSLFASRGKAAWVGIRYLF